VVKIFVKMGDSQTFQRKEGRETGRGGGKGLCPQMDADEKDIPVPIPNRDIDATRGFEQEGAVSICTVT